MNKSDIEYFLNIYYKNVVTLFIKVIVIYNNLS